MMDNNPTNYVSGSIQRIRKQLKTNGAEAEILKTRARSAVQKGIHDFLLRLETNQIKVDNVSDFEKLVKLGLLLHNEATERVEHTTDIEGFESSQFKIVQESPEFEVLKNQLSAIMNERNENTF